jgi:hypothetical protein
MAIKTNQPSPQLGRITTPKGTFFSNPSTAASGSLGGIGVVPGVPNMWAGTTPGYNAQLSPNTNAQNSTNPFADPYRLDHNPFGGYAHQYGAVAPGTNQIADKYGQGAANYVQAFRDAQDQFLNIFKKQTPDNVLGKPTLSSPSNSLVGNGTLSAPNQMTLKQVQSVFGSMSVADIQKTMEQKGYQRTYIMGVGEVFVRSGESAPLSQQAGVPLDSRGRPEYVDGASLAQGERVTNANGFSYVGGTPYTNPAGETVGQYAVTVPGVKDDPKGMYKWTSTTKKDSNGNWVKVYKQQLRKVYSKGGREQQAARQESAVNSGAVSQEAVQQNYSQLVNLRADYG